MRSVWVGSYGSTSVLEMREMPVPEPGAAEVRIRVKVAGINYADIMQRLGLYPNGPKAPFPAGFEVAGVVDQVGSEVTEWHVGDEVMAFCQGGYSDYVISQPYQIMPKPEQLSWHQAAAVPCQYLTAYHALLTLGQLKAGQTVLVQAAAGGLGTLIIQIARNVGAISIGTASTAEKCALIRELGCPYPVQYTQADFRDVVKSVTRGQGCELVIETVGGNVFDRSLKCLRSRGMLVTLGIASAEVPQISAVSLLANNWIVAGMHLMGYVTDRSAMAHAMRDLHTWLLDGKLEIIARHAFPLEEAARAHDFISGRQSVGKVVLHVAD
ncbi:MAG: NADPH:quinone oxidoreductase family protein [Candidatus Hydrogenedentes bacterium]|nr:NADPH:quinone oxidoreductase family protein [Candidatus Hydrogenedentota bacterium]